MRPSSPLTYQERDSRAPDSYNIRESFRAALFPGTVTALLRHVGHSQSHQSLLRRPYDILNNLLSEMDCAEW